VSMRGEPVVSVELILDDELDAAVRAEWAALAATGGSSLAHHPGASNRPHITLLVRTRLPRLDADALRDRPAPALTLGAPVLFGAGDRRVLARSVVVTDELLALHAEIHALAGAGDDAPFTAPGAWTPHVTLARRLRLSDTAAALEIVTGTHTGAAPGVRRWDAATSTVTPLVDFAGDAPGSRAAMP
jgi:2'-5' RNA ligase